MNQQSNGGNRNESDRLEPLLQSMTLPEKVALLAGATQWRTTPIERLAIPAIKTTDGPNGARGARSRGGPTSACFPVGICLAATWNCDLVEEVGAALAEEAKSKGAHMLLAPTVNMLRSPLNGRNFECYSEDPTLTSRMAVAFIRGVQSQGVGATVKHFVCNDSEFERTTISSEVDQRTLREIYLPPFQAAVRKAGVWGVMASYNKVNGVYTGEHPELLMQLLKQEWGFDGIVMSDWYGTQSTAAAVAAGLDLEMPGPPQWRGDKLLEAIEAGAISLAHVDEAVRRVLRTIIRVGAFENPEEGPEEARDLPEHRTLARRAAVEGIVLLKNSGDLLPLDSAALKSLALIGPNARTAQIRGGGSSRVNPHYAVTPFEGVAARLGQGVEISYEIGCTNHRRLPLLDAKLVQPPGNESGNGFALTYFNTPDLSGEAAFQETSRSSEQAWTGDVLPAVDMNAFSVRMSAIFTPTDSGEHRFSVAASGSCRLVLDGDEIISNWPAQTGDEPVAATESAESTAAVRLEAGVRYDLVLEYSTTRGALASLRLGHLPLVPDDALARAVSAAAESEVALVCVGLNSQWESEGFDRPHMDLVGDQDELVTRVAAVNPNTIVLLQTGSPIAMPWLDQVAAVVQAWYPGQECGNAVADVLFGDENPSGKLPQTFPARLADNPAYINYPGENGTVRYGEGLFVGYRYYEKKGIAPLFPFGFGLSYTSFDYRNLRLSASAISAGDSLEVSLDVTNDGPREGQEIVQLYIRDVAATLSRPKKELKAFAKISLEPGETQPVSWLLDRESLAFFDDARQAWVAEAGEFEVLVGSSSADIRAKATFRLAETTVFGGSAATQPALTVNNTIGELLADESAWAIVEKHLPGISEVPELDMALSFSLVQVAGIVPDLVTQETLDAIAADLARI